MCDFNANEWMSFREASEYLGVLFQQVYQKYQQGKLTTCEMFGKRLVLRKDIEAWKVKREEYFNKKK